ncbi:MAG: DNA-processing protein DprA [Actinomycetota bacterium]|nr:DNA-processing protein DprA [Actinomycetota bacterium]
MKLAADATRSLGARRWELALDDSGYPDSLALIADPPKRLYGMGNPELLRPGLAVIGARKSTPYGRAAARLFAGWAAQRGEVIVSGAAIGCDQAAHRAALEAEGSTVAVLGCGADVDYPKGAHSLIEAIRQRGCVLSELPWGTHPARWAFAKRNRIIAGLSHAVLVVEASVPSGTFLTADFALSEGREVFAVPGSIFAPECRGANRLIIQGASPVTEISDLAALLGVDASEETGSIVTETRDEILAAITANPMRPDDISHDLGIDIVTVAIRLSELEHSGLAHRYPDARYGAIPRVTG